MDKLLKVTTILLFLLATAALTFGCLLFARRELLKGRTQKLEQTLMVLGTYIEEKEAEPKPNTFASKDIADCTPEVLANPQRSDFWRDYPLHLEELDLPKLKLSEKREQLMKYYLIDPVTLQIMRDPVTKVRLTDGEGTMQELLTDLIAKTENQLNRLNRTREQLRRVREELIATIDELNVRKNTLREKLNRIVQLENKIVELETKIRELEAKIAELEAAKRALEDEVAQLKTKVAELEEIIKDRDNEIKDLKEEIRHLRDAIEQPDKAAVGRPREFDRGDKGTVVSVNKQWNFVVVKLNEETIASIVKASEYRGGEFPRVEFLIRRPGEKGAFVTKIRIVQMKREEGIAIGDIMSDWAQQPVQENDVVFY